MFADPDIPLSEPVCTGGGGGLRNHQAIVGLYLSIPIPSNLRSRIRRRPITMDRYCSPSRPKTAMETVPSVIPFTLTQDPNMAGANLRLNHNPSGSFNPPGGFNDQVEEGCAVIGVFHVIQFRINPLPPADSPALERRDLGLGQVWTPVAANIENLQFQYSQGTAQLFEDAPGIASDWDDPNSWITGVRISGLRQKREHQLERRHRWGLRCRGYALEADVHHLRDTSQPARARRRVGGGERRRGLELSSRSTPARTD